MMNGTKTFAQKAQMVALEVCNRNEIKKYLRQWSIKHFQENYYLRVSNTEIYVSRHREVFASVESV